LSGKQLAELKGHQSSVFSASFSADGQRIVTASGDNTARVWDLSGKQLAALKGHQRSVTSASFSADGQRIVTTSGDNTARVWDLSGKQLVALKGHQSSVTSASFSPDRQRIVTASWDNTARVWDLSGKQLAELKGHQDGVYSASFSPDGQRIVTASDDNTARVWDLSGQQLAELKGHQSSATSASFSPDGQRIVTASRDKTARVWDLSGKQLAELKGHQSSVTSASFSPDGQRIVTASLDKTARLWDLSGKQLAALKGHQSSVTSASFSPDGQRIVTASEDKTARVWDLSGKQLAELKGHQSYVTSASFNSNGQRIVTASDDNTARVWRADSLEQLLQRGCDWLNNYLIASPQDLLTLTVCQTPANRQAAPILVQLGEAQARSGNVDEAIGTFRTALIWNHSLKFNPEERAKQLAEAASLEKVAIKLVEESKFNEAAAKFNRALLLDPDRKIEIQQTATSAFRGQGEKLGKAGKTKSAIAAYAQEANFISQPDTQADRWNSLCWDGSLQGFAQDVMFACEKAVNLAPKDGGIRDSRGLARALTNDFSGAVDDFQAFIDSTDNQEEKLQRQAWIKALRQGKNPFTPEVLTKLKTGS